ncbi:PREDICTED: uncharacterized protein LOC109126335 [Camelina sativa]|uniref:Uncharacterized protein LOC109126335 n=1 Tax=Camelina sativa TaxID=90675 RepID=A0ABM1QF47_CAMSA|nr:PREDICTED: uncharacterized protein LOC109126335 [Camelina sativa]
MSTESSREENVYKAKLAEQAERYEEMVEFMEKVAKTVDVEELSIKEWNNVMTKEVDALEVNKTGELVDLPPNKVAIGCQWIYKTKYSSHGTIDRYKARLVDLGNNQAEEKDYKETFAPIVHMKI